MALAGNKLPSRLALLVFKLRLLTPDPCQPGNSKEAYRLIIYLQWCSHPYPTSGWIHTKMKVLDVLANHVNDKTIDSDLVLFSTHLDASLFLKFGSPGSHLAERRESHSGLPAP